MILWVRGVQREVLEGRWGCLDKSHLHETLIDVSASPALPHSCCPLLQVLASVLVILGTLLIPPAICDQPAS